MDMDELIKAAEEASLHAYAPYSDFRVGAAILTDDGKIFAGTNVENRSFGLTVCAERNAVGNAILHGMKKIKAAAVYSPDSEKPLPPCGACRQVLSEFSDQNTIIILSDKNRNFIKTTIGDLYPMDSLRKLKKE